MQGKPVTLVICLVCVAALLFPGARMGAQGEGPVAWDAGLSNSSWQSGPAAGLLIPDGVASPWAILYSQMDNLSSAPIASQNYESGYNQFDSQAADDFIVPTGIGYWKVSSIDILGTYNVPGGSSVHVDSVNVQFYAAAGSSLPKTLVYSAVISPTSDTGGAFVVDLKTPAILAPDTYWLSIQANMNYLPERKQWLWRQRTVQSNSASVWKNPGNAYGTGCITWSPRVTTCRVGDAPDLLFRLNGTVVPENPLPTIVSLTPSTVLAGKAFTLIVDGTNFVKGALVGWNGQNRAATYANSTRLQVSIPASDVSTSNTLVSVTVFNPAPGGGRSNALTLHISTQVFLPLVMSN